MNASAFWFYFTVVTQETDNQEAELAHGSSEVGRISHVTLKLR